MLQILSPKNIWDLSQPFYNSERKLRVSLIKISVQFKEVALDTANKMKSRWTQEIYKNLWGGRGDM